MNCVPFSLFSFPFIGRIRSNLEGSDKRISVRFSPLPLMLCSSITVVGERAIEANMGFSWMGLSSIWFRRDGV